MSARSDLVDLEMVEHLCTERAIFVSDDGDREKAVWLPLSAVEVVRKKTRCRDGDDAGAPRPRQRADLMGAWAQTLTGRALVFAAPEITREHLLTEVAHGLACVNRYAGQLAVPFSVAQHSVMMADAVETETRDVELAAFCLLHDAHEAYFGDLTRPALEALGEALVAEVLEIGRPAVMAEALRARLGRALARVKRPLDRAVIEAAGLSFARFEARHDEIATFDLRMLRTERDLLMMPVPQPWAKAVESARPLRFTRNAKLKCWAWPEAEERFRDALDRLCPDRPTTRPAAPAGAAPVLA